MQDKNYLHRVEALVDRVEWRDSNDPEPTFGKAARERLQRLADPFFAAAKGDLLDIEALHQFRILGKALRYGIENFAAAVAPEMRGDVYPLVEQLQEKLGKINDHASAVTRFQTWADEWSELDLADALETLVIEEKTALQECRREFHAWWTMQRVHELEDRFHTALVSAATESVA
jgi:CHAD domain-containing protein